MWAQLRRPLIAITASVPHRATRRDQGPLSTNFYYTSDHKMRRNPDSREVNQQVHIQWLIPLVTAKRGELRLRGIVKSSGDVMSLQCYLMTEDSHWPILWRFSRTEPDSAVTELN